MINAHAGIPVYVQVAAEIRQEILSGRLRPGEKAPSEAEISERYSVGRATARKAIGVLRTEGLVVVPRGHGAYVREMPEPQDLVPEPGAIVIARMPTADERTAHAIDDGVPVFEVTGPTGVSEIFPADLWRLRWPGGH